MWKVRSTRRKIWPETFVIRGWCTLPGFPIQGNNIAIMVKQLLQARVSMITLHIGWVVTLDRLYYSALDSLSDQTVSLGKHMRMLHIFCPGSHFPMWVDFHCPMGADSHLSLLYFTFCFTFLSALSCPSNLETFFIF